MVTILTIVSGDLQVALPGIFHPMVEYNQGGMKTLRLIGIKEILRSVHVGPSEELGLIPAEDVTLVSRAPELDPPGEPFKVIVSEWSGAVRLRAGQIDIKSELIRNSGRYLRV